MAKAYSVIRKQLGHNDDYMVPTVMGTYATEQQALERIKRIESANRPYKLREFGHNKWIIGPEEYQGFFGDRPNMLWIAESRYYE